MTKINCRRLSKSYHDKIVALSRSKSSPDANESNEDYKELKERLTVQVSNAVLVKEDKKWPRDKVCESTWSS